ncbi:MAG: hypothetical protein Q7U12_13725, partial [Undibacterium sp.]|nr:hypothetical protein [Undibacterium sp.]
GTPTITLGGSLTALGGNQVGGDTSGSGATIHIKQDALLNAATVTLDARGGNAGVGTGGNVQFDGAVNSTGGARALSVTAGKGDVTFSGAMGATSALSALTATGNDINVANIGGAAAGVTGATALTATTAGADAGEISFTGTTYNANAQTYVATAGNTLKVNAGAATTFTSTADNITFGNAGNANGGTLLLADGSNLSVGTNNGAISAFAGVRGSSAETVSLNAGTSTLSVGQIGAANEIASAALTSATTTLRGDITTADVAANNVTITGAVTLASGVTIDTNRTTNKGDITITGASTGAGTALSLTGKAISTGAITTTGAANGDGGAVNITGSSTVTIGAITTSG